jgi:DNA-binding CsgD family transcriptional regulator
VPPAAAGDPHSGTVGRARERAALADFVAHADPAGPRALLLAGPPGSGKTTLLTEAAGIASGVVRTTRAVAQEAGLPHTVLADLVDGWDADDPGDAGGALSAGQQRVLRGVLTGEPPPGGTTWRVVGTTVLALLRSRAASGPVLLVVDDAQWADPDSLRVLGYAVRRAPVGVRLLASVRTALGGTRVVVPEALAGLSPTVSELGDMPASELAEVVRRRFPDLPAPRVREIVTASGANPFVAMALARRDPGTPVLPVAVEEVTGAALARLGPAARRVVEGSAVLQHVTAPLLAALLAGPAGIDGGLDEAEEAGVLRESEGAWEFTHPLFRAAASEAIPARRRQRLHLAAAGLVTGEERARHLAASTTGPDPEVSAELADEARRAAHRGSPDLAVELWRAALRCTPPDRPDDARDRWFALARVLLHLDRSDEARDAARNAVSGSTSTDDRCRALALEASAVRRLEGREAHNRVLSGALDLNPSPDCEIDLLEQLLPSVADAGRTADLADHLARLDVLATLASPEASARASATGVLHAFQEGRLGAAAALDRLRALDGGGTAVEDARNNIAMWAGQSEVALAGWEAILSDLRSIGDVATTVEVLQYRTDYDLRLGRTERARHTLEGPLAAELSDVDGSDAFTHELWARLLAHAGDAAGARAAAGRSLALAGDAAWLRSRAHAASGLADLVAGRPAEAARELDLAVAADPDLVTWRHGVCFVAVDRVEALAAAGDVAAARVAVKQVLEQANLWGDGWVLAAAARSRAHVLRAEGDHLAAYDAASTAVELSEEQPFSPDLGRALLAAAAAARQLRRRKVARDLLDRAGEVFTAAGYDGWLPHVRTELSRIGGRPAATGELTRSEELVARLVAEGHSNREVAERLSLSVRTVESHLSRAYAKLGVTSRTGLSRRLLDLGGPPQQSAVESPMP